MLRRLFFFFTLFFISLLTFSHSGRTDSSGGHTDKKTGRYHYHTKKSSSGCSYNNYEQHNHSQKINKKTN